MGETIIKIENMYHTYKGHVDSDGEVAALTDINLTVTEGEFVAIIGVNGSGKSTLAKHHNALLLPSSGKCFIKGMDTADPTCLWKIRQTAGMVFQNPDNQIVAAVVEEDVAFGPENLGISPSEIIKRVEEALDSVEMQAYRLHSPHLLSGGQKQRIAIAGVLAMRPKCLVLDEPTAMLDPKGRSEVLNTVLKLNKTEGITIVYITHFMEEAVEADRVVVMAGGRILEQGTPRAIFSDADKMKNLGLDVPVAAQVSSHLRVSGLELPDEIIKDEELVAVLCP